jgi:hypothetical protein
MCTDNQGRPPFEDEGRVEHHNQRPLENKVDEKKKGTQGDVDKVLKK